MSGHIQPVSKRYSKGDKEELCRRLHLATIYPKYRENNDILTTSTFKEYLALSYKCITIN